MNSDYESRATVENRVVLALLVIKENNNEPRDYSRRAQLARKKNILGIKESWCA